MFRKRVFKTYSHRWKKRQHKACGNARPSTIWTTVRVWNSYFLNLGNVELASSFSVRTPYVEKQLSVEQALVRLPIFWSSDLPLSTKTFFSLLLLPQSNSHAPITLTSDSYWPSLLDERSDCSQGKALETLFTNPLVVTKASPRGLLEKEFTFRDSVPESKLSEGVVEAKLYTEHFVNSLFGTLGNPPQIKTDLYELSTADFTFNCEHTFQEPCLDFIKMSSMFREARLQLFNFMAKIQRPTEDNRYSVMRRLDLLPAALKSFRVEFQKKFRVNLWMPEKWALKRIRFKPGISKIWRVGGHPPITVFASPAPLRLRPNFLSTLYSEQCNFRKRYAVP